MVDFEAIASNRDKTAGQIAEDILDYIKNPPLRRSLNKYPSFWEQLSLLLLNVLMLAPLAIPGAIKYATTGQFFFSQNGRSLDQMDDMAQDLSLTVVGYL